MVHKSEVETLEDDRLLYPSRLQGALTKVSNDRVNELIEYEYGWLKVLSEKLGIFIETIDGRMNVPEIYLHGFGLKRRGGIKRPRG